MTKSILTHKIHTRIVLCPNECVRVRSANGTIRGQLGLEGFSGVLLFNSLSTSDESVWAGSQWTGFSMSQVVVSGIRRLSTISEKDVVGDVEPSLPLSAGGSEWAGSRVSLCLHEKPSEKSSTFTSFDSYQADSGEDCAAILLACLYCRFSDIVVMLPNACERALGRCFPSYRYYRASNEQTEGKDCCTCKLELDCGLLDACQETSELLELAMEISEVCYR